jgi:hypothetical protein
MRSIGSDGGYMRRVLVLLLVSGCGGRDIPDPTDPPSEEPDVAEPAPAPVVVPTFRNPVAMLDDELALRALKLLGANVPGASTTSCNRCHNLTHQELRGWRAMSDTAMSECLTDLKVPSPAAARTMIDCLRAMPTVGTSDFQARKLGIYAAAVHLPWFEFTAKYGYGATAGPSAATHLVAQAGMPRVGDTASIPLTQEQFDVVAEWFVRGLPELELKLPPDPAPTTCRLAVSVEVAGHVNLMKTQGWRAINATSMMAMHGCGTATDPRQCLQSVPLGVDQPFGVGWDLPGRGKLRVLADETYRSSYWSRSSPDGRFFGHGVQNIAGSYIIDLQRGGMLIPIAVDYDPNWFPDNSGFVFQGSGPNTCAQSVLTSNPAQISMTEPECTRLTSVGLYEHVGARAGGDHFAVDSRFVSDDGGHSVTLSNPSANFSSTATLSFTPIIYDGTGYTPKQEVTVPTGFEGDFVIAPSAKLVISRVAGPNGAQLGYVLRKVVATPVGDSYNMAVPEVGRYCLSGGKPAFSYDERWIVYHHYVTPTDADAKELGFVDAMDPGFAPYKSRGAANMYLLELATGITTRFTNMPPGQYALYPHFRSDGWIYGVVRDTTAHHEYMVASDAALLAEQ